MPIKRLVIYLSALLFPPLAVGLVAAFSHLSSVMLKKAPDPVAGLAEKIGKIAPPPAPGKKPRAALLVSNDGTGLTDLMAAAEVLGESGAVELFTIAESRIASPLTGNLAILPHYGFQGPGGTDVGPAAEILVVPPLLNPAKESLKTFLAARVESARLVLSLGEGARALAAAGVLRNRRVTSHFLALEDLRKSEPSATWLNQVRYVEDGKFISSEGLLASADAALFAVEKLSGRPRAVETAERLGLRWSREPDPTQLDPSAAGPAGEPPGLSALDLAQIFFRAGFDWGRPRVGALLYPGVSELALSAPLDTLPRTQSATVFTTAARREVIRSLHGLDLIPSESAEEGFPADLLIVPSSGPETREAERGRPALDALKNPAIENWINGRNILVKSESTTLPGNAFERSLAILHETQGESSARLVSKLLRLDSSTTPSRSASLSQALPFRLWLHAGAVSLVALLLAVWAERRFRRISPGARR